LIKELAEKQALLAKLNQDLKVSGSQASKLEYFEGEVRRLESKLAQQKVSYER
jgi:hypothetical protein